MVGVVALSLSLTCAGIHVCGQTSAQHFHERISTWIPVRTAQRQVLENVRDAGVVFRSRSKRYTERVDLVIVSTQMQVLGVGFLVLQLDGDQTELLDLLDTPDYVTV